jgi:arsenite methyltransferase
MAARQIMYEDGSLSLATGGMLHPGGWILTERILSKCELYAGSLVLDVGCGNGSTARYLSECHAIDAIGVDKSELLLHQARAQSPKLPLTCALGPALPIASKQVDIVLAECSFSAMAGIESFLAESWRVLRSGGWLAISDVYIRNPAGASALRALPLTCGLRDAVDQIEFMQRLHEHGFDVLLWEDRSETLKELAGQIALSHGSISTFWSHSEPGVDPFEIAIAISKAKLGYFVLIAQKNAGRQRR